MTMLDVVGNHMGHSRSESYKDLKPFNKPEYYHKHIPGCDQWGDIPQSAYDARPANATLIEQCRLQSLPDLNQTVPFVRDQLLSWLERTLQKYDFDGLRVDTVKHVDPVRLALFAASTADHMVRPERSMRIVIVIQFVVAAAALDPAFASTLQNSDVYSRWCCRM
jgi:glycosidase